MVADFCFLMAAAPYNKKFLLKTFISGDARRLLD
jgi:hypothetical protein